MKISVIVPCRNEKQHISRFLESVQQQEIETGWSVEILVADGMSDDGTRAILRQFLRRTDTIRLIDNPGRIVSTGLNAAIEASTGDVIIRMDAHTVYAPDYIKQCVRTLESSAADNVGGPWVAKGQGVIGKAVAAAFQSRFCTGTAGTHDPHYEGEVDTVYLGCWRRSVFDWAGLFDADLVRNQDDEFNFRLRRLGGRIWQCPRIRSEYTPRNSLHALFRQYLQYGYWRVAVIRKYKTLASWRHIVPAGFASALFILLACAAMAQLMALRATSLVFMWIFASVVAAYLITSVLVSLQFARSLELRSLALLPVVFAVHHFGYGLGFLAGIFSPPLQQKSSPKRAERAFTTLTR